MPGLTEQVRSILYEETPKGEEWAWDRLVSRPGRDVNEMEFVSRFWGYAFGVAYGIARSEDPDEPNEVIAMRAYEVAVELFEDQLLHDLDLVRALGAGKAASDAVVV